MQREPDNETSSRRRPSGSNMAVGIAIGVAIGAGLSLVSGNPAMLAVGVGVGVAIGASLGSKNKR